MPETQNLQQQLLTDVAHRANIQPLSPDQVRFEIDMCIGCDRCMRACPVPLSAQIPIAELNQATISDGISAQVMRFTQECVMCGSCVPVCPVDNHRDLLMLSLKQRLGASWNSSVDTRRVLQVLPQGWDIEQLLGCLRRQALFSDSHLVSDNYLLHFVLSSKLQVLDTGTVLFREGEFGRAIYFLLGGRVELATTGTDGQSLPLAILRAGEYTGEQEMLTGQVRSATACAQTPCFILEVPEQAMQRMMELVPAIQQFFECLNVVRSVEAILQRMALFQGISSSDLHQLAEMAQIRRYDRDALLFSEDSKDQPARETLHLLLDGFVKVARRTVVGTGRAKSSERVIAYRQGGDYFIGGLDTLGDLRAVTTTAITRVTVAEIPQRLLTTLFGRYPEVKQRFQERLRLYRQANLAANSAVFEPRELVNPEEIYTLSDAQARAGLHALVSDGVVEGTEVLVIDLDKCIHCNECEEACERRHGQSRMNRKGMVVGNMSIATACRQCQDPVCMLCSRAGIARKPSGEVYITESCIGCGICAERCPYDNISIMELPDEETASAASWQKFSRFFTKGAGKERGRKELPVLPEAASVPAPGPLNTLSGRDALGEMRKKIAVKCDLCAGYSNQACVQACPTGAAFRVNPVTFFGSTDAILSKRTK